MIHDMGTDMQNTMQSNINVLKITEKSSIGPLVKAAGPRAAAMVSLLRE